MTTQNLMNYSNKSEAMAQPYKMPFFDINDWLCAGKVKSYGIPYQGQNLSHKTTTTPTFSVTGSFAYYKLICSWHIRKIILIALN